MMLLLRLGIGEWNNELILVYPRSSGADPRLRDIRDKG